MRVADIGCGIGGPLISMARVTGATITGININARQLARAEQLLRKAGTPGNSGFVLADFLQVPVEDGYFDALYSFEAVMQSPDVGRVFAEAFRVLRGGGELAVVDWCLTERFDAGISHHRQVRAQVENLNATPHLLTTAEQVKAVEAAGFEILASRDQAVESDAETPWFRSLQGRDIGLSSLARVPIGRKVTATVTTLLERLHVVPRGTAESARVLNRAADALVEAGKLGIFTPSFLVHARKSE